MKDLLEYLVEGITGSKEFEIEEADENGNVTLKIKAKKDIVGQIIGKGGNNIKAIQSILRVRSRLEDKYVVVNVEEA